MLQRNKQNCEKMKIRNIGAQFPFPNLEFFLSAANTHFYLQLYYRTMRNLYIAIKLLYSHGCRNKMAIILQTIFLNGFSWKVCSFWLNFRPILFLWVRLPKYVNMVQAITWCLIGDTPLPVQMMIHSQDTWVFRPCLFVVRFGQDLRAYWCNTFSMRYFKSLSKRKTIMVCFFWHDNHIIGKRSR